MGIILFILALIVILIVIMIKMLNAPKKTMKTIENSGDLRGKSYNELCEMFGKPTSVSVESNGEKSAYWCKTNGFQIGHAMSKDTTIYAVFDSNGVCYNYSYESNR